MRRIVCTQWGPPEDLVLVDEADPVPGEGQVLVEVGAAGVNFVDALFVAGTYQIKVPPPFTPGSELAGTVTAVGEGVEGLAVGDRVLSSLGLGAYASHAVLPALGVTRIPDGIDVARSMGARVIAAASTSERLDAARAMGASETIAYEDEDLKVRARELSEG